MYAACLRSTRHTSYKGAYYAKPATIWRFTAVSFVREMAEQWWPWSHEPTCYKYNKLTHEVASSADFSTQFVRKTGQHLRGTFTLGLGGVYTFQMASYLG